MLQLACCAERALPDLKCTILMLDERGRLHHRAAPTIPRSYTEAIDGLEIGPDVGSCGAAAHRGVRFIVEDVRTHPNWTRFRELAEEHGLRACWSQPLFSHGRVTGTLAVYSEEARGPRPHELHFLDAITRMAEITIDRQIADDRLQVREERFRQITESIHEVFWLLDRETGDLLYVSPAYETIWGKSRESLYADPASWRSSVHPEDRGGVEETLATSGKTGHLDHEYRILRPDGSTRWIHTRAFPIEDEEHALYRIAGISGDVTRIKERELGLQASEASFRELAENIGAVFWLTDWDERRVLYVSPNWETVWGQDRACLFDENTAAWALNIHEDDRERVLERFRTLAELGRYEEDFRVVHSDQSVHWLHERAYPIHDSQGRVRRMAGIAYDITRRKHDEQQLATARDQIEELRRRQVESLTAELLLAEENERRRLARELHDGMNQLITLALLKLAQLRDMTSAGAKDLAIEIERIVEKAGHATRSLTYQLSPPILHDLGFVPALQWLAEDVEQSLGLRVELEEGPDTSGLDERVRLLLFRAVRELLVNVARHAHARNARLTLREREGRLEITVADDGVAFDAERVGQRGIGLLGIRERLNHLGGEMRIDSVVNRGTRITLVAPLHASPRPIPRPDHADPPRRRPSDDA